MKQTVINITKNDFNLPIDHDQSNCDALDFALIIAKRNIESDDKIYVFKNHNLPSGFADDEVFESFNLDSNTLEYRREYLKIVKQVFTNNGDCSQLARASIKFMSHWIDWVWSSKYKNDVSSLCDKLSSGASTEIITRSINIISYAILMFTGQEVAIHRVGEYITNKAIVENLQSKVTKHDYLMDRIYSVMKSVNDGIRSFIPNLNINPYALTTIGVGSAIMVVDHIAGFNTIPYVASKAYNICNDSAIIISNINYSKLLFDIEPITRITEEVDMVIPDFQLYKVETDKQVGYRYVPKMFILKYLWNLIKRK